MSDLIYRQDAVSLPVMPKRYRKYMSHNLDDVYEQGWEDLQMCIEHLPSAQPKRKKGRWVELSHGILFHYYKCDQCGNTIDMNGINAGRGDANYCPNCGARMEGGRNE